MPHCRAQLRDIAILVCRLLALYLLVVGLGEFSEGAQFLRSALLQDVIGGRGMRAPFPAPGTASGPFAAVVNNLPQARYLLTNLFFTLMPVALYLITARQLWSRAPELASRMVGDELEEFEKVQAERESKRRDEIEESIVPSMQQSVANPPSSQDSTYEERTWDIRRVVFAGIGLFFVVVNLPPIFSALLYALSNLIFWTNSPFGFLSGFTSTRFLINLFQALIGVGLMLGTPTVLQMLHRVRLWATQKPTWTGK